jgi:hypothetical protein
VHGVDAMGRVLLRKTVRREQLVELIAGLPRCLIGMEGSLLGVAWIVNDGGAICVFRL